MCAFLAIGQQAIAQTLGQAAVAARKAPAVDPALRADIEKLMVITGSADLAAQMASQVTDAFLNSIKESTQNVVPPRAIEIIRELFHYGIRQGIRRAGDQGPADRTVREYFTHADMKGLIAFYETDLWTKGRGEHAELDARRRRDRAAMGAGRDAEDAQDAGGAPEGRGSPSLRRG